MTSSLGTWIGIEEHWVHPELDKLLGALPATRQDPSLALNDLGDNLERLTDVGEGRIAAMDAQGVAMQILSIAPPGTQPLDGADAVPISRDINDLAAEVVQRHPTRFRAMATLPLADPAAAAEELRRADSLGLVGAMVYGRTGDITLDDPRFDDVFAVAAQLQQPIFIHPQIAPTAVRNASYAGFDPIVELGLATFGWGWHLEAATAALRLVVGGTLDRHPDLQLVLGHWGELLLFWGDRVDSLSRVAGLERRISEYFETNFHITISGMLSRALLNHVLEVTTIDRLMFSTDFPFQRPTQAEIETFTLALDSDSDREKFMAGNARRLFRIDENPSGR